MKNLIILLTLLISLNTFSQSKSWTSMSNEDQIWLLDEIKYYQENDPDLPKGTRVISFTNKNGDFDINRVQLKYKKRLSQILKKFTQNVSREEIDQSSYELDGQEQVRDFHILINDLGEILGGSLDVIQHGVGGDVNWDAEYLFGEDGELFPGIEEQPSFSWSGH